MCCKEVNCVGEEHPSVKLPSYLQLIFVDDKHRGCYEVRWSCSHLRLKAKTLEPHDTMMPSVALTASEDCIDTPMILKITARCRDSATAAVTAKITKSVLIFCFLSSSYASAKIGSFFFLCRSGAIHRLRRDSSLGALRLFSTLFR